MTTQTEALAGAECDRQQSNEQVEPTCWITPDGEGFRMRMTPPVNDVPLGWTPLFYHPPVPTAQPKEPEQEPHGLAAYVIGCFSAAQAEGLQEALAETTDERLKDLVERRLMHAFYAAQNTTPPQCTTEQTRQWVGLTDEDKMAFLAQDFGGNRLDAMDWAEQRLKEKNT